ncbi:hypothetical protein AB5I41_01685 [Sphingomonas sp. MMS24-JH45]
MGLRKHPTLNGSHASPDGLVGEDGLVEIKAPRSPPRSRRFAAQRSPTSTSSRCSGRCVSMTVAGLLTSSVFIPWMPVEMQLHITWFSGMTL